MPRTLLGGLLKRLGVGAGGATVSVAPVVRGYVEELSAVHMHGWACEPGDFSRRVTCEAVLADGTVVGRAVADQFRHGLASIGIGDGTYAFWTRFSRELSVAELEGLRVRVRGSAVPLPVSPALVTQYEPLLHVAMDIVDNCNLRCPFCLYDYSATRATHMMTDATLEAALRFLPLARDGEFWFSCLHEPTLHPRLIEFIERVPAVYRRKLFFTTNIAKPMTEGYFRWLAGNGMHHINVSIESRDPAIYERMRKGARHRIFLENWDRLMAALAEAERPTPIRYIAMAYKSNLRELPELARYLIEERHASQVEIRYTYDVPFIPPEFRRAEFLDEGDWDWLAGALAVFDPAQVLLIRPPGAQVAGDAGSEQEVPEPPRADAPLLPGRYMFRMSWDGSVRVVGVSAASRGENAIETVIAETNVCDIGDPAAYFDALMADVAKTRQKQGDAPIRTLLP